MRASLGGWCRARGAVTFVTCMSTRTTAPDPAGPEGLPAGATAPGMSPQPTSNTPTPRDQLRCGYPQANVHCVEPSCPKAGGSRCFRGCATRGSLRRHRTLRTTPLGGAAVTDRWATSTRRARLPKDWKQRVSATRHRAGGRCEARLPDGTRCTAAGTDCDHVVPNDDHRLSNLQWLCHPHHEDKTKGEAAAARHKHRRQRPAQPHIGLLPTAAPAARQTHS